jgi:hypothetical protein
MSCPYLREVVMLFCDGYPVKKMLPLDRIATAHPCLGQDFEKCPLFRELVARIAAGCDRACGSPDAESDSPKETSDANRTRPHARDAGPARPAHH